MRAARGGRASLATRTRRGRGRLVLLLLVGAATALVAVAGWRSAAQPSRPRTAGGVPLQAVQRTGVLESPMLREASGLAPSTRAAGVFWSHNDSGHEPWLHALDLAGRDRGLVTVTGASNRDWEAIAAGPCDGAACLYVGDVGDNLGRRPSVTLWRVREPAVPGRGRRTASAPAESLVVRYPDGGRDVEAMWVDASGDVWLVTKRRLAGRGGTWQRAHVYRVASAGWHGASPVTATLVDSLPHVATRAKRTLITDAALAPSGRTDGAPGRLAVRTYGVLFVFETPPGSGRPLRRLATCDLAVLGEAQGEAIAWLPDGRLLFASEGRGAPLHVARCP